MLYGFKILINGFSFYKWLIINDLIDKIDKKGENKKNWCLLMKPLGRQIVV